MDFLYLAAMILFVELLFKHKHLISWNKEANIWYVLYLQPGKFHVDAIIGNLELGRQQSYRPADILTAAIFEGAAQSQSRC